LIKGVAERERQVIGNGQGGFIVMMCTKIMPGRMVRRPSVTSPGNWYAH